MRRSHTLRATSVLITLALATAACASSGDSGTSSDNTTSPTTTPASVDTGGGSGSDEASPADSTDVTTAQSDTSDDGASNDPGDPGDDDTVYPVEPPPPDETIVDLDGEVADTLPPISALAHLDMGVAQGLWSEPEGLAITMRWLLGDIEAARVPGLSTVTSPSFTGIVNRAARLVASGQATTQESAELAALVERIALSEEILEGNLAAGIEASPRPAGFASGVPQQASGDGCARFSDSTFDSLARGTECFGRKIKPLPGSTDGEMRVYYPTTGVVTVAEATAVGALETVNTAVMFLDDFTSFEDVWLIFSPAASTTQGANDEDLGVALYKPTSGLCTITIFPAATTSKAVVQKTIAHEVAHCAQYFEVGNDIVGPDCAVEGVAEYMSHAIYPGSPLDYLSDFDAKSLTDPLSDLSYGAWVWWLFLAQQPGWTNASVWSTHIGIIRGSGSLDSIPDAERIFHEFVIAWAGVGVVDLNGGKNVGSRRKKLQLNGETGERLTTTAAKWVALRTLVTFPKQRSYRLQPDASGGDTGLVSFVEEPERQDRVAWTEPPAEVLSGCKEPKKMIVATTTTSSDSFDSAFTLNVTEAPCDPCWIGTWSIDLASFQQAIVDGVAAMEGGFPAGASFNLSGSYLVKFADQGHFDAWRDNFTITITAEGNSVAIAIDAIEAGTWTANAESESGAESRGTFTVPSSRIVDSATVAIAGGVVIAIDQDQGTVNFLGQTVSVGVDAPGETSGDGSYVCNSDTGVLTITTSSAPTPIVLNRVDNPPPPKTTLTPAD